jgi:hypothetical protein
MTLHAPNLILKLSTSVLKGVINRECQIGVPLVCRWCSCDVDFPTVGEGETYMNIV